jgi:type VI protein secretion system component Hcp
MADNSSSDLLMLVKPKGKIALEGEALTKYNQSDDMMQDFKPQRYCELQDFSFGIGLEDNEGGDDDRGETGTDGADENKLHGSDDGNASSRPKSGKSDGGKSRKKVKKFKTFMETGMIPPSASNPNRGGYEITLDEITITRQLDRMSVPLVKLWFDQTPLDYIIVVRRKFTGNPAYHEAFLRIKFTDVLITAIDWKDGDSISETMKFVYRGATVAYKPQKADGTLAQAISAQVAYDLATT